MFKRKEIPFHGNHNNISCGQCTYKMILTHFFPDQDWSHKRMNEICGASPGKYTWKYKPITELADMGLRIQVTTTFDTERFYKSPSAYLTEKYDQATKDNNIMHSDMPRLLEQAARYMKYVAQGKVIEIKGHFNKRTLRNHLDQDYLANIWVNSQRLNDTDGFMGHFILIYDYDDMNFIAHDPGGNHEDGRPKNQFPARRIPYAKLISAASPRVDGQTSDMVAIKL